MRNGVLEVARYAREDSEDSTLHTRVSSALSRTHGSHAARYLDNQSLFIFSLVSFLDFPPLPY